VEGKIYADRSNIALQGSTVRITGSKTFIFISDTGGYFLTTPLLPGNYKITISHLGYAPYRKDLHLETVDMKLGAIFLTDTGQVLDEVKVVEKIMAIVQKDDTTEYDSKAYKVNPDADAADMAKKMPGIDINGNSIKAQGEQVTKVLIDGKPFFGNDPYASLRNLPADVIAKVQVYNEKSEQEQFTGFSEGNTTKTINIITKTNKRNGIFGKANGGVGLDNTYGLDANLNKFDNNERITITGQSNNTNIQNFTAQTATATQAPGTTQTNAAGVNYTNKIGKKLDLSGSYFYNETNSSYINQLQRRYITAADSGQDYSENNSAKNNSYSHRFNSRINFIIDSANTFLFQPQISIQKHNNDNSRYATTTLADSALNQTLNNTQSAQTGLNLSGSLLYRHKFKTKGRTLSVNIIGGNVHNNNNIKLKAFDEYYSSMLTDTINQQTPVQQNTWNTSTNIAYTEPITKKSQLQLQYTITYIPTHSDNNAYNYSYATGTYTIPDTLLSNSFRNRSLLQKAGGSYQVHGKKLQASVGLYYQTANFSSTQFFPYSYQFTRNFENLLPVAMLQYKLAKTRNLQVNYTTSTFVPSVTQLQGVVNNSNPLHLTTGNPSLVQPYQNNITLRYNATDARKASNFYISASGGYTQHAITNNAIIAQRDTIIQQNILLPAGAQLTTPVNINGNWLINISSGYGIPLNFIRSNLSVSANASLNHIPVLVNGTKNYQDTKTGGTTILLSSNINENIDFTISTTGNLSSSTNTLNTNINSLIFNESTQGNVNIIFWKGFIYNTQFSYQANTGLSAGYDINYLLLNMSIGKKLGKKRIADVRIVAYDILNQATNIQHTITDLYVQDARTNMLHRYFMLAFNYKIRAFKPS